MIRHFVILVVVSYVSCQNLMLSKGSTCAWNGTAGQCVTVYKCLSAVNDIKNKRFPPLCSFEGKTAIVCCTDCDLVEDTRLLLFNPMLGILTKTGTSKAKDKCLDYIHTLDYPCKKQLFRIVPKKRLDTVRNCTYELRISGGHYAAGGRNALREEFPHMALLGFGDTIDTANWLCGGTVISERFILTAAHCLSNLRVISFSSQVLPACLHIDDMMDSSADATGWGASGNKQSLADILQSVNLRMFTEEECSEHYPKHRHLVNGYDTSTQMCYGDVESQPVPTDTCEGDSGGPLQSKSHEMCVFTILGVTSFGRECGVAGGAGIYTRVKYYVPWIEDIVWP